MPMHAELTSRPGPPWPGVAGKSVLPDDGFSAFLKELHAQTVPQDAQSRLVEALADGRDRDVAGLLADAGDVSLSALLGAVDLLERFGLVVRAGAAGQETFRLSPTGVRASQAMGVWRGGR